MTEKPQSILVQPGSGRDLHAFGNILSVMISGQQSGGTLAVMSEQTPPGGGPPLHYHTREDEIFLVIEGKISYFANDAWTEVAPGGVVYLPKGTVHTYRNTGETLSRHWIITLPSGFENFFAEAAAEFGRQGGPNPQRIVEIHHEHGIELV